MVNSLFVSCAFSRPERTYDTMAAAVQSLGGRCVEIHYALWHIKTDDSAGAVRERLKPALDVNDQLVVIDASNGKAAWINLRKDASGSLRELDL